MCCYPHFIDEPVELKMGQGTEMTELRYKITSVGPKIQALSSITYSFPYKILSLKNPGAKIITRFVVNSQWIPIVKFFFPVICKQHHQLILLSESCVKFFVCLFCFFQFGEDQVMNIAKIDKP